MIIIGVWEESIDMETRSFSSETPSFSSETPLRFHWRPEASEIPNLSSETFPFSLKNHINSRGLVERLRNNENLGVIDKIKIWCSLIKSLQSPMYANDDDFFPDSNNDKNNNNLYNKTRHSYIWSLQPAKRLDQLG